MFDLTINEFLSVVSTALFYIIMIYILTRLVSYAIFKSWRDSKKDKKN